MSESRGRIYLLHFDSPFSHARHYLGYAGIGLHKRLAAHAGGRGARLTQVVLAAGIGWTVSRVWKGTRKDERRLKQWNGLDEVCPLCRPAPRPVRWLVASRLPWKRFRKVDPS